MREAIAKTLLITSRIIAGFAVLVDAKTVQNETAKTISKMVKMPVGPQYDTKPIKLDDEYWGGQYL